MTSTRQKRLRKRRPPPADAPAKPPPKKPSPGTPASVIAHREKIAASQRKKNPGGPFYTPPFYPPPKH